MRTVINVLIIFTLISCSGKPKTFNELTDQDFEHETSSVNGETIYYKTAVTKNDLQTFFDLDASDSQFFDACRFYADSLIKKYFPDNSITNYTPDLLDKMIDMYIQGKLDCTETAFVNSIGIVMGDYLVTHLDMKWVIIEDRYGRDFAVTIDSIRLTNFPLNSVLKDIEHRSEGSCNTIYLMTLDNIKKLTKK